MIMGRGREDHAKAGRGDTGSRSRSPPRRHTDTDRRRDQDTRRDRKQIHRQRSHEDGNRGSADGPERHHRRPRNRTDTSSRSRSRTRRPRDHRHHRHHDAVTQQHARRADDEPAPAKPALPLPPPPLAPASAPASLPCSARRLTKNDLDVFLPLLARYLEIQKQRFIEEVGEHEVKGRWKRFVGKWNRGELAEGWYDPEMFARVVQETGDIRWREEDDHGDGGGPPRNDDGLEREGSGGPCDERDELIDSTAKGNGGDGNEGKEDEDEEDDAEYGPILPCSTSARPAASGPTLPTFSDITLRREDVHAATVLAREQSLAGLRYARKADRAEQKGRLEELAPRADAGSHERRVEKRREATERIRMRARDTSPGAGEVGDDELMGDGGGGNSREEMARVNEREQRKKTEREIRRAEWERAKKLEREDRIAAWKIREEATVDMLRELARQRFG